jgi:hypothetical protein
VKSPSAALHAIFRRCDVLLRSSAMLVTGCSMLDKDKNKNLNLHPVHPVSSDQYPVSWDAFASGTFYCAVRLMTFCQTIKGRITHV